MGNWKEKDKSRGKMNHDSGLMINEWGKAGNFQTRPLLNIPHYILLSDVVVEYWIPASAGMTEGTGGKSRG